MSAGRKVLVVEDDGTVRSMLRAILEADGYEVLEAANGDAGVAQALARLPDLIVMDIMLPNTSGFEATRAIRADPRTRHIPILVCTVKSAQRDLEWALLQGADDFLAKPFAPDDFRARVRKLLPAEPA